MARWRPTTIFKGFGGPCEARNNGDAVVRYDQLADRWLIVMPIFGRDRAGRVPRCSRRADGTGARLCQVNLRRPAKPRRRVRLRAAAAIRCSPRRRPGGASEVRPPTPPPTGTYAMCYAVSTTSDPLGPYYRYEFVRPLFPDYPRPAIWPDGYYMPTSTGDEVIQKHVCVADRAKMLKGGRRPSSASIIDGVNFLNNADIDGKALPPAGAPNMMMAAGGTQLKKDLRRRRHLLWKFHVDWKNRRTRQ